MQSWVKGAEYRFPGAAVTEHTFQVPLDHSDPGGEAISIFALEVVDPSRIGDDLPWLLFLQGGPGGPAPRPHRGSEGWFSRALRTHRVLLLDQRGTGRSTPLTWREASQFGSAKDLARYIGFLRADSIVDDAEFIRARLSPDRPWETLGQSYGGRITMTYLSRAPEGLRACYIAGGLPSLTANAYEVSQRTIIKVRERVQWFYQRYPEDAVTVQRLRDVLLDHPMSLPGGRTLTLAQVRQLGQLLGMGDGPAKLHWLLSSAFASDGLPSDSLIAAVEEMTDHSCNPLHAVLLDHVKIEHGQSAHWPGARAMQEQADFDERRDPMLLTGEFTYPWMFDELPSLRPFREAMHILNDQIVLPALWETEKLSANKVPVAAIIYHDDMYVDAADSLSTAATVPCIRHWITNEWQHDGLRASGGTVLNRLITMAQE